MPIAPNKMQTKILADLSNSQGTGLLKELVHLTSNDLDMASTQKLERCLLSSKL